MYYCRCVLGFRMGGSTHGCNHGRTNDAGWHAPRCSQVHKMHSIDMPRVFPVSLFWYTCTVAAGAVAGAVVCSSGSVLCDMVSSLPLCLSPSLSVGSKRPNRVREKNDIGRGPYACHARAAARLHICVCI